MSQLSPASRAQKAVGWLASAAFSGAVPWNPQPLAAVRELLLKIYHENLELGCARIYRIDSYSAASLVFMPDLAFKIVRAAPMALQEEQADRIVAMAKLVDQTGDAPEVT